MKLCPVGFRQIQTWQYKSMVPKTKQKERVKGLTFARLMHPVPHNHPVITNMSISPMHPNTLPPYYQTIPHRSDEGYWPGHGERLGNMGVFGTFDVPLHDNDTRGVIVQIVEHWGCEPEEGWTPTRNFRSSIISRRVEAHVTGCEHVHTEVVFPPHLLARTSLGLLRWTRGQFTFPPPPKRPKTYCSVLVLCGTQPSSGTWLTPPPELPFPKGIVGGFCGVGRCLNGTSSDAFA